MYSVEIIGKHGNKITGSVSDMHELVLATHGLQTAWRATCNGRNVISSFRGSDLALGSYYNVTQYKLALDDLLEHWSKYTGIPEKALMLSDVPFNAQRHSLIKVPLSSYVPFKPRKISNTYTDSWNYAKAISADIGLPCEVRDDSDEAWLSGYTLVAILAEAFAFPFIVVRTDKYANGERGLHHVKYKQCRVSKTARATKKSGEHKIDASVPDRCYHLQPEDIIRDCDFIYSTTSHTWQAPGPNQVGATVGSSFVARMVPLPPPGYTYVSTDDGNVMAGDMYFSKNTREWKEVKSYSGKMWSTMTFCRKVSNMVADIDEDTVVIEDADECVAS